MSDEELYKLGVFRDELIWNDPEGWLDDINELIENEENYRERVRKLNDLISGF